MSRRPKVTILYEDARGPRTEFGLHRLVLAAVRDCDAVTAPHHEVDRALDSRPLKGIEQVLRTCRQDLTYLACDGRKVAVVVDEHQAAISSHVPAAMRERVRYPAT